MTDSMPGTFRTRSRTFRYAARVRVSRRKQLAPGRGSPAMMRSYLNPGSAAAAFSAPRAKSPPVTSRASDSAIWPTTSRLRARNQWKCPSRPPSSVEGFQIRHDVDASTTSSRAPAQTSACSVTANPIVTARTVASGVGVNSSASGSSGRSVADEQLHRPEREDQPNAGLPQRPAQDSR